MAVATETWTDFRGSFHWDEDDGAGAGRLQLSAEDVLSLVRKGELTAEEAVSLSGDLNAAAALLPLGIRMGLSTEELLFLQLLTSFDRRAEDPELLQWMEVKGPRCPFFLFAMKASAESAQVSWWKKKKRSRFSPERPGYTAALRVARLGADGFHLEQAGEGGQPGALCYHVDVGYAKLRRRPKGVVVFEEGSGVPVMEVALVRRLPSGDGVSITSHVNGLGVQLGDILFVLPCCAATVALSFTEEYFTVPTKFTEEPLYGRVGLNFVDITGPMESLIKKLYSMYEQEEQDNKVVTEQQNNGDHEERAEMEREELMQQGKEQEKEKRESLRKRRAESKKNRCMRKEVKKMIGKANLLGAKTNDGYKEESLLGTLFSPPPECD